MRVANNPGNGRLTCAQKLTICPA